ncbi:MAG: hypothetical protein U5K36_16025 [Roseovarius sp.]|nr:hypothetical protein [Roseovarius sp.]
MILLAAAMALYLSLQSYNTVAGIGMDVSSGDDAVADSAEQNQTY